MKILRDIYPDKDGVHCGKCGFLNGSKYCWLFGERLKEKRCNQRLPECLKAQKEALDLKYYVVNPEAKEPKCIAHLNPNR